MKFPTHEEFVKMVAEEALDEFLYDGKSLREWVQIIGSEDAISRQAVLDLTGKSDWFESSDDYNDFVIAVCNLPPVNPQPKMGTWIPVGYDGYADGNPVYDYWECSECKWEHTGDEDTLTAFCPNCGIKMEVKE